MVGHPDSPDVIAEHLAAMAARYAEAMHSAQVSEYLWRTGLAPVDIGDIDLAGITTLAARRFGPAVLEQLAERVGPVGATPILAGLDLAGGSGRTRATY